MKLLRIDSSARNGSVSRQLTAEFAALWKANHPDGEVIERDLAAETFPTITDEWVSATRTEASQQTSEQLRAIASSDRYIAELTDSDTLVIGTPMHNYSISWPLKAWIDQIVRIGRTVEYGAQGPKGLLQDKEVVVITSHGGSYPAGTPRAHMDFVSPYLRLVFNFIGLTKITFIHADNQYRPDLAAEGKAAALRQVADAFAQGAVSPFVSLAR